MGFNFLRKLDIYVGRIYNIIFTFLKNNKVTTYDKLFLKKVLLIKLWGLGNLTIIWSLIYKIKEKFPETYIIFLTFDINKEFIGKNEAIDKVVYFTFSKNIFKIITQFFSILMQFRQEKIDLVINFETFNNTSALFSYLTNADYRVGLSNGYEKVLYDFWVKNDTSLHISKIFTDLLKPLGINSSYNYFRFNENSIAKAKIENILNRYTGGEKFVCMHPGTSRNFQGKRWKADNFSVLSNLLIEKYNLMLIFTGIKSERTLVEDIAESIYAKNNVLNLAGLLNIWELIELLRKSFLFISNDTGPVHLAASLGINMAVFYGPTSPYRYKPLNENALIFYKNLECSPCIGIGYINEECRNNFKCLDFPPRYVFSKFSERFLK